MGRDNWVLFGLVRRFQVNKGTDTVQNIGNDSQSLEKNIMIQSSLNCTIAFDIIHAAKNTRHSKIFTKDLKNNRKDNFLMRRIFFT